MSKLLKSLSVVVAISGGVVAVAQAAEPEKAVNAQKSGSDAGTSVGKSSYAFKRLKRLDSDRNGGISQAEYLSPRLAEFKELDANADSTVDPAEIGAQLLEPSEFRTKRFIKRIDANRDGKISREEFEQGPRALFAGRDVNSDGKINDGDKPPSTSTGYGWFGGGGSKKMGLGAGRSQRPDLTLDTIVAKTQAEFNKIDANADGTLERTELDKQAAERIEFSTRRTMHWSDQNKDGKISQEEFSARTLKRFSALDLNDDGQIDSNDFPTSTRKSWFSR